MTHCFVVLVQNISHKPQCAMKLFDSPLVFEYKGNFLIG